MGEPPWDGRYVVFMVNAMRMELGRMGAGRLSTRIWMDRNGLNIEMTDRYSAENEELYYDLERKYQDLKDLVYVSMTGVTITYDVPMYSVGGLSHGIK